MRTTETGVTSHETGGAETLQSAVSSAVTGGHALARDGLDGAGAGEGTSTEASQKTFILDGGSGAVASSRCSHELLGGVDVVSVVSTTLGVGVTGTGLGALVLASSVVGRLGVERVATSTLVSVLNTGESVLATSTAGGASSRSHGVGVEDGTGQQSRSTIGPTTHVTLAVRGGVWVGVGREGGRGGPNIGVTA